MTKAVAALGAVLLAGAIAHAEDPPPGHREPDAPPTTDGGVPRSMGPPPVKPIERVGKSKRRKVTTPLVDEKKASGETPPASTVDK